MPGPGASLELLAPFALDVWLTARFGPTLGGTAWDGRSWERTVAGLLHRPGFTRRQGPGRHRLFGGLSASGVPHEVDGAADGWRGSVVVECKATGGGISKGDVALFHIKVMDFYRGRIATAHAGRWWALLCGTMDTAPAARATAISLGLLVCDPARLPLPVLVRAAGRPGADLHLPETLLQEILRLGERALAPLQDRYRYHATAREIGYKLDLFAEKEIEDLLWLEGELSAGLLDLYERRRPGALERRAAQLIALSRKVS